MAKYQNSNVDKYASEILRKSKFKESREHAYRSSLENLIESSEHNINALNDSAHVAGSIPDFLVYRGRVPVGYIEAKDIGVNLNEVLESEQIKKYHNFGNLIVTDYLEFIWFVDGIERQRVRIADSSKKGGLTFDPSKYILLEDLLSNFVENKSSKIVNAKELAVRLATSAKSIKNLIVLTMSEEADNGYLKKWKNAFAQVLISDLTVDTFADMFAQTLAYGFFAARVHHTAEIEFSRFSAAKILPKTNPFLKKLFQEFAGVDMPDSISWAVDEIVEILGKTDLNKILADFNGRVGKEDPIIHFYESFLYEYDSKTRELRGVYYTPEPIVDFIVKSADTLLIQEFDREAGLADDRCLVLDPALGTGSFLHKVIDVVKDKIDDSTGMWDPYVSQKLLNRIFGFEILMAPYAVSHLKLGLQLQETGYKFQKNQRLGVFLTNTLESTAKKSDELFFDWVSKEANDATEVKQQLPIMALIGNPPYSAASANKGEWITNLLRGWDTINKEKTHNYFEVDGLPLNEKNPKWINDDYVKFIRFAQWRIEQSRSGIVAFVTNHGFIDNPTFRGMRHSLTTSFDDIYILDLHGSSKKKENVPPNIKDENVFDIQQGVSICFFIRLPNENSSRMAKVHHADLWGTRDEKYAWLKNTKFENIEWTSVVADSPEYLFIPQNAALKEEYSAGISLQDIFVRSSVGIVTGRDHVATAHTPNEIQIRMKKLIRSESEEVRKLYDIGKDSDSWSIQSVKNDLTKNKINLENPIKMLYRPFDFRYTYYTGASGGIHCRPREEVMVEFLNGENLGLISARSNKSISQNQFLVTDTISELKAGESTTGSCVFPLFLYPKRDEFSGQERRTNFKPEFSKFIASQYGNVSPVEVFDYIYAVSFSTSYRERYASFLKLDFPKIQFTNNKEAFLKLSQFGKVLRESHLQKKLSKSTSFKFPAKGNNIIEFIKYNIDENAVYINKIQKITGITREIWNYEIGGYQVIDKWLKARKERELTFDEITQIISTCEALDKTIKCQSAIDSYIKSIGGLPLAKIPSKKITNKLLKELTLTSAKKALNKLERSTSKRRKTG